MKDDQSQNQVKSSVMLLFFLVMVFFAQAQEKEKIHKAPAPLFRDPITDGAADPAMFYNPIDKEWWMLYTQRRANLELPEVAFCYGNSIAIASSNDHGKSWIYRGTLDLEFEHGQNTFWAPDIVFDRGEFHLFVSYIQGVRSQWGGEAKLAHYTSKDLWNWKFHDFSDVGVQNVIDGSLIKMRDGNWRMFFKGPQSLTMMTDSKDLVTWKAHPEPVIKGEAHEGPNVFEFAGFYWMLTDEWHGMRVYRSKDLTHWEKQGMILDDIGIRPDDSPTGAHGDAVVTGGKAYVFYFTHPGRKTHVDATLNAAGVYPYQERRSSIQVAELVYKDGTLKCKRNEDFDFLMAD
ncbi:MAG: glycosyl hydrolase [Sphingobacterium sp.]|jgi:beta-xylosidase|uniref:glycosyl hydrolase n=1 Tax=unclassified Sphingobacterium TaxID=2609468 RepID=UPI002841D9A4|nr:glycosyl hydrolase [Sphingobacterium sp.]MDR3010081.1 glycosyl hydrolase [Sphingobacterium sp.]